MSDFSIGLSGLNAAQKAMDIIGNNIANAATEGYHRQEVRLTPAYSSQTAGELMGGGVNFEAAVRIIDTLLEQQILMQNSVLEQLSQQLRMMHTVEASFGEFSEGGGLNAAIDSFFNAMQDLSLHPAETIYQEQVLNSAEALAGEFRMVRATLTELTNQLNLEAENVIDKINNLAAQIAELNNHIERLEIAGAAASNLKDQRDEAITELSKLIGVQTYQRDNGVVDVNIGNIPLVSGTEALAIEGGLDGSGKFGIAIKGSLNFSAEYTGGSLGGILAVKNELVSSVENKLDLLAQTIINEVNRIHVQGVGSYGSFTELVGWTTTSDAIAELEPQVSSGKIYIRITDIATGVVQRYAVDVDASSDTLATIAAKIDSITGVISSADSSKLRITAEAGFTFDFLPAVLAEPSTKNLTGAVVPAVSVSGIYSGELNQTYTCTVTAGGTVSNGNVTIEIRDGTGEVVNTVNVGQGYAAGDVIDLADGIKISIGAGDLNAGDSFTIDAYANTDTSGLLSAAGLNTFFSGKDAATIAVSTQIKEDSSRIAAAAGAEGSDNTIALKLAALRDKQEDDFNGQTIGDFYRGIVAGVGADISSRQAMHNGTEMVLRDLTNQRDNISSVNINDEAAKMLMYEQMFEAMSKYLNTINSMLNSIMELL